MKFKFYQKAKILFGVLITLMSLGLFSSATFAAAPPTSRTEFDIVCEENGIGNFEKIVDKLRCIDGFCNINEIRNAQIQALCLIYINNCEWESLYTLISGRIFPINLSEIFLKPVRDAAWIFLSNVLLPEITPHLSGRSTLVHYIMFRVIKDNAFDSKTYDEFTNSFLPRTLSAEKIGLADPTPPGSPRSNKCCTPVPKACFGIATDSLKWGPFFRFIENLNNLSQQVSPLGFSMNNMRNDAGQTPLNILNGCQNIAFVEKVKGILGLQ